MIDGRNVDLPGAKSQRAAAMKSTNSSSRRSGRPSLASERGA
jgi:hypothetical protein